MASLGTIAVNERKWQAEDDARTLARAAELQSDAKRMAAAKKVAAAMVSAKQKELVAMKRVAGKPTKPTPTIPTRNPR